MMMSRLRGLQEGLSALATYRHSTRYAALGFIVTTILFILYHGSTIYWPDGFSSPGSYASPRMPDSAFWSLPPPPGPRHPIDELIASARDRYNALLLKRSLTAEDAAATYRERRGRHPPPGFDSWFRHALKSDAIIVEDFFDRIYDDLSPFWGMEAKVIRSRANSWWHVVRVRDGIATGDGDTTGRVDWLKLWTDLVSEAAPYLPDVDMPINYMDESRVIVPHEKIAELVRAEHATRTVVPIDDVVEAYSGLQATDAERDEPYDPDWATGKSPQYWKYAHVACAPGTPGRDTPALDSYDSPPNLPGADWKPEYALKGFVSNFTASQDICTQAHLRGLHGSFVEPISMSTTDELIPLFGGCKLTVNNEILIPGAKYLTKDPFYSGGEDLGPSWNEKKTGVVWRGMASGGRHHKKNWRHFHRLRLVEMLNGTTVESLEAGRRDLAGTFALPNAQQFPLSAERQGKMGEWLGEHSNVGFTHLLCFPKDKGCTYWDGAFSALGKVPMKEQYKYKYLPDADGNSFSARFRGFLRSTSLPLKATIYAEWHDDRLIPWLHFVPMDNTFRDMYAILDWLSKDARGDAAAEMIATTGAWWASKVLRRDDMLLYVWRLLLEWARVCDDEREKIGWVDDLR